MNVKWKEYTIDELGSIGRGKSKFRPRNAPFLYNGPYPFVQTGDIKEAVLHINNYKHTYSEEGLKQSKLWDKGTLCITIAANIAETAILGIEACFPDSIVGFIGNNNKCNVTYIKYYFDIYKLYLQQISQGATQDNLSLEKILKVKFLIPPLGIQNRIASVLSAYDKLIEINEQRITLLENSMRELYKEWFVRMRFPGYKENSITKGIPKEWIITNVGNIIEKHIGGGWGEDVKSDQYNIAGHVIRGTDIPNIRRGIINKNIFRYHKKSNMSNRQLKEDNIIFETAGGSEGQLLGRCCYITSEILNHYNNKVMCASFCKMIQPKKGFSIYLYCFLDYLYTTNLIETFQVQSTGISNFQFNAFVKYQQLLVPTNETLSAFEQKIKSILKTISLIGQQNQSLAATRDLLLPRLISGKLKVKSE